MNWLTPHAKHILLAIIIGISLLLVSYKVVAHLDGVRHDEAVLAKAKLDNDFQIAKVQATQTQVDNKALQIQFNALVASNASLKSEVVSLHNQLADQRKQDAALTPTDLSVRWSKLIKVNPVEISPTPDGKISVSDLVAHTTVDALEEVPVLQTELKTTQDNSLEKDKTIDKQAKALSSTETELQTCKKTVIDQADACKKEVKAAKASGTKKAFWAGLTGGVIGFVLRKFI